MFSSVSYGAPPLTQLYTIEDFSKLSETLTSVVPDAKAATVCIDLGDGSSGSGVIISPDGLILSAAHVTQEVGKKFEVIMEDGTRFTAVGLGLNTSTDASMARILPTIKEEEFPYVPYTTEVQLRQYVFSLGHSGGFDKERGIVLRLGRVIDLESTSMRTDCTLIGGDSGGPLFDLKGRLIGIHSRVGTITSSNTHVPIENFQKHWQKLEEGRLWGDGTFANAGLLFQGMRLLEVDKRLEVVEVRQDTNAATAGFLRGDHIIKVNNIELNSLTALVTILADAGAKGVALTDIPVHINRDGSERTLTLSLND